MIKKLVLGTVQLGLDYGINNQSGRPTQDSAFEILNIAYDKGVSILDTAEAYGNSQEIIGNFLKKYPHKSFKIITKLSANSEVKSEGFLNHLEKNCSILNVNKLYGYMFHNYQSFKSKVNLYDKLLLARQKKIIEKTGISLYTNSEIDNVLKNYKEFDFIQIPFNLFDNANQRKDLLDRAQAQGVEVHVRSVFLQGLFFKTKETLPEKLKVLSPYLDILTDVKRRFNLDTITLALQYVLQKEYIDHVLIGVETPNQLKSNIAISSTSQTVPHELIDAVDIIEKKMLNPSNWS